MKTAVAIGMGLISGFLIYLIFAMLFSSSGEVSTGFVLITLVGGWIISAYLLRRGARTVSKVVGRGFLLGAAEWLMMIPATMVLSGRTMTATASNAPSDAELAGATLGAGLASAIGTGVSVMFALVCMLGFAVAYFMGREMKPEAAAAGPTRRCPDCAEEIQAAARKCRYCGAAVTPLT